VTTTDRKTNSVSWVFPIGITSVSYGTDLQQVPFRQPRVLAHQEEGRGAASQRGTGPEKEEREDCWEGWW
jgi:hypothetical protein